MVDWAGRVGLGWVQFTCNATRAVCIARVRGDAQMAWAEERERIAAASEGEVQSSPLGSSSAAEMACFRLDACENGQSHQNCEQSTKLKC